MGGGLDIHGPKVILRFMGIPITETVTNTWLVMVFVIIGVHFLTRKLEREPRGWQHVVEMYVDLINGLVKQAMGADKLWFAPYIAALVPFLFFSNILGLIGLRPPTADLNLTLGMAMMTFFMIHFYSIKTKGLLGYLKGYLDPFPLFLPMNITGELAKPISLSFRLFGNLLGGSVIMALIYHYAPIAIPIPFHIYFDLFAGFLQTFIFSMLTMVFIAMAIG